MLQSWDQPSGVGPEAVSFQPKTKIPCWYNVLRLAIIDNNSEPVPAIFERLRTFLPSTRYPRTLSICDPQVLSRPSCRPQSPHRIPVPTIPPMTQTNPLRC